LRAKKRTTAEIVKGSKAKTFGKFIGSVYPGAMNKTVAGIENIEYLNAGFISFFGTLKYY
jgi:hypothetical protein